MQKISTRFSVFRPQYHNDLISLNPQSLATVHTAFTEIDVLPKLMIDIQQTHEQHRQALISSITQLKSKMFQKAVVEFRHDRRQMDIYLWTQTYATQLSQDDYWSMAVNKANDRASKRKIAALYHQWQVISDLACCSSAALIYLANVIIPFINEYITFSQLELQSKRHDIHPQLYINFRHYLHQLQSSVTSLQQTVVKTMAAKLQACSDNATFTDHNLVQLTLKKLQPTVSDKTSTHPTMQSTRLLDNHQVTFMNRYIEKHGKRSQQLQLKQRAWFTNENGYVLRVISGNHMMVPQNITRFIPKQSVKTAIITRFYSDYQIVHTLFKDKIALTHRIKTLSKFNPTLSAQSLLHSTNYQYLRRLSKHINQELISTHHQRRKGISQYIFTRRNKVIDQWQDSLLLSQRRIIGHKISLLAHCIKSLSLNGPSSDVMIFKLIKNIKKHVDLHGIDENDKRRFQFLQASFQRQLAISNETIQKEVSSRLQYIVDQKGCIPEKGYTKVIYNHLIHIGKSHSAAILQFKKTCQNAVQSVLRNTSRLFESLVYEKNDIELIQKNLIRSIAFITKLGLQDALENLSIYFDNALMYYTKKIITEPQSDDFPVVLLTIEILLITYGNTLQRSTAQQLRCSRLEQTPSEFHDTCVTIYIRTREKMSLDDVIVTLAALRKRLHNFIKKNTSLPETSIRHILLHYDQLVMQGADTINLTHLSPALTTLLSIKTPHIPIYRIINTYLSTAIAHRIGDYHDIQMANDNLNHIEGRTIRPSLANNTSSLMQLSHTQIPTQTNPDRLVRIKTI